MNNIHVVTFTSLAAVAIGAVTLPAAAFVPAQLATEVDDVLMTAVGYDLGGSGFSAGVPTTPAQVVWTQTSSGATNTLDGSIHFDGVSNNCARVELISYDANSVELGRNYSTEECVGGNGYFERPISVQGIRGAAEVRIRLQSAANVAGAVWTTVRSQTIEYGPTLGDPSEVAIVAPEFDLGTGAFTGGTASAPATVTWTVAGANEITPSLSGTLYMKRADDLCGRMRYTYLNQGILGMPDTVLETRYGIEHCVTDDLLHMFAVNTGNYSNVAVDKVEIAIESSPNGSGNWTVVGSVMAYLPSVLVPVGP